LLEDLIRPHLQPVLEAELASTELASAGLARPIIVLDAPHVFEWKIEDWFDRIFVVSADMGVADARVAASRDLSLEEVRERRAAQLSDGERRGSFEVVDNNGSLDDLRSMAERIWQDLADAPGAG
jgi:dephospho-CoA kinase